MSFIIAKDLGGKTLYWKYGALGGWTTELENARQYAQRPAANQAVARIIKRKDGEGARVERLTD